MSYLLILSTVSSKKEAHKLADLLLTKRLAACINLLPGIESHYWWKGKKEKAAEVLMLIKTKRAVYKKLEKILQKYHSYSIPEIIALPIQKGNSKYLKWLSSEIFA